MDDVSDLELHNEQRVAGDEAERGTAAAKALTGGASDAAPDPYSFPY